MNQSLRLRTPRIDLIASDPAILRADTGDRALLRGLLNAAVPPDWPTELYSDHQEMMAGKMESGEWGAGFGPPWYWVHEEAGGPRTLFGSGGFYRMPGESGDVMCGYSIVPSYFGRGFATEAMRALLA